LILVTDGGKSKWCAKGCKRIKSSCYWDEVAVGFSWIIDRLAGPSMKIK
jgi:hypothetical protein